MNSSGNGGSITILLWVVNILLGLLIGAVGLILKMHKDSDDERAQRVDREIALLRQRMHDWASSIGWVEIQRSKDSDG